MKKLLVITLLSVVALGSIFAGLLGILTLQREQVAAEIENESPTDGITRMADMGSTSKLEILPLVEKVAASSDYQSEHGVSYLIKTDSSTMLMDLGFNPDAINPSPLEHNMAQLGIRLQDIDTIIISHWHPDHVGGPAFWQHHTFSFGNHQIPLASKRVFLPSAMSYPGLSPIIVSKPVKITQGVASTGIFPIFEVMNSHATFPALADLTTGLPLRNSEQALAINVKGRGIVLITGCGHPTLPKLVARSQVAFDAPVVGVIGGLHLTDVSEQVVKSDI